MKQEPILRAMIKDRVKRNRKVANRLGRLCMSWSHLELDLTLLLHSLMGVSDPTVNNTILGVMGLREKIQALHTIGFKRAPSRQWYDSLSKTLTMIDNDLRPERNRMIHDFWITDIDGDLQRSRLNPRVVNVKSRTKAVQLSVNAKITPELMSLLCSNIETASVAINLLNHDLNATPSPNITRVQIPTQNPDKD
jgi:hypothetical protein